MKRIIAVLMAVLMLCGCMSVAAFAASEGGQVEIDRDILGPEYGYAIPGQCTCMDKHKEPKCDCCIYCPNLDRSLVRSCVVWIVEGESAAVCCADCTGLVNCNCGCGCAACATDNKDVEDFDNNIDDIWGPEEQESFIDAFQAILKRISDAFDKFFDAIFEFLRIDDVLGKE